MTIFAIESVIHLRMKNNLKKNLSIPQQVHNNERTWNQETLGSDRLKAASIT